VYVTFGSEAPGSPHFPGVYRRAIEELTDYPVLMTIGDRRDAAELGPLPPNVRVEGWVAADEIAALPSVDDAVVVIQRSAAGHAIR
jgi:UDP:flavonoid glycosyltransferase YjiC (YdhE family)